MKRRAQKIIMMMLAIVASSFCGLAGCGDKYKDMKLETSTSEINLYLGRTNDNDEVIDNTREFTTKVSGVSEEISRDVFFSVSDGSVKVEQIAKKNTDSEDERRFKVTALSTTDEASIITMRTKEGNKTAQIKVNVIKEITGLNINKNYKPFAIVGEETYLDTARLITFEPEGTNQKDVMYRISNANGHIATITANGKLLVEEKHGTQDIEIEVISKAKQSITKTFNVKVIKAIENSDIEVLTKVDGVLEDIKDVFAKENYVKLAMAGNEDEQLRLYFGLKSTDESENYSYSFDLSNDLVALNVINSSEINLRTTGDKGTAKLVVTAKMKGYDYAVSREIDVEVIKLPTRVIVNNEEITEKDYDIYTEYANGLGQRFEIEIGDKSASDTTFVLGIDEQSKNNIDIYYSDGTKLVFDNNGDIVFESGQVFYVVAKKDFNESSPTAFLEITAKSTIGKGLKIVEARLNFNLRVAVKQCEIYGFSLDSEASAQEKNTLYISSGEKITLTYNFDVPASKAYVKGLQVLGYNSNLVKVEIDERINKPVISITGLSVDNTLGYGLTSLYIKLPNGFTSNVVNIFTYNQGNNISLKSPSLFDEQYGKYISEYNYDMQGNLNRLVMAIISGNSLVKLNVNNPQNATIYKQTFTLDNPSDKEYIAVYDEGYIAAIKPTEEKVFVTAQISLITPSGNHDGNAYVDTSNTFNFSVESYNQIRSISLDKQYLSLYYGENLFYVDGEITKLNQASLKLNISPKNVSVDKFSDITWSTTNDNITLIPNGDQCSIIVNEKTNMLNTALITATVVQKNKAYSKTCFVELNEIIRPTGIVLDGYRINNSSSVNTIKNNMIYIDVRDNISTLEVLSHVLNNATNQNVVIDYNTFGNRPVKINNDGTLSVIGTGKCEIIIYPQGSVLTKTGDYDPSLAQRITIYVADGSSQESAFQIANEQDFWKIFTDSNGANYYYTITEDIHLTKSLSQVLGSIQNRQLNCVIDGYFNRVNHSIFNLRLNTVSSFNDQNYVALFSKLGAFAGVKNLDIEATISGVNNLDVQNLNMAVLAYENNGLIQNVSLEVNIEDEILGNYESFNYGTYAVINNGQIVCSDSSITSLTGNSLFVLTANNSNIGGCVAINNGIVSGIETDFNIFAENLNNVGGIVGYNTGLVLDSISQGITIGNENVGGLVGQNQAGQINSSVVFLYENEFMLNRNIQTDFAYISGNQNVGGLIGYSSNGTINSYLVKSYCSLCKIYENGLIITKAIGFSENDTIENADNQDLAKVIPNEINVIAKSEAVNFENDELTIYVNNLAKEWSIDSLLTFKDENDITIDLRDLSFKSSNENVLKVSKNKIKFTNYGRADLIVYVKLSRDINKQIKINFVHDLKQIDIQNKIDVKINNNLSVLATIVDFDNKMVSSDNVLLRIERTKDMYGSYHFEILNAIRSDENYYYINSNEIIFKAKNLATDVMVNFDVVEVFDGYEKLFNLTKQVEINIFNGIESIYLDKGSVDLTTNDQISLVLTVVTDTTELKMTTEDAVRLISGNTTQLQVKGESERTYHYVDISNSIATELFKNNTEIRSANNDETYENILKLQVEDCLPENLGDGRYKYSYPVLLTIADEYSTHNQNRRQLKIGLNTEIKFGVLINGEKQESEASLTINIEPQELLKIDVQHFSEGMQTTSNQVEYYYNTNEIPSNIITPGEYGLLVIDLYPEYAVFDELKLSYEASDGESKLLFIQSALVTYENENGEYFNKKYVAIKQNESTVTENYIILSRISNAKYVYNSGRYVLDETDFDGKIYVKTLIPTDTPSSVTFKLTITGKNITYDYNENGELVEREPSYRINDKLTLKVLPLPSIKSIIADLISEDDQKVLGEEKYILAKGMIQQINADSLNYNGFISFSIDSRIKLGGEEVSLISVYNSILDCLKNSQVDELTNILQELYGQDLGNEIKEQLWTIKDNENLNDVFGGLFITPKLSSNQNTTYLYVPIFTPSGTIIEVTSSVSRFVNGIEQKISKSLDFVVADYIVTGIKANNSNNNHFNIGVSQTQAITLSLETLNADFDDLTELYYLNNQLEIYADIMGKRAIINAQLAIIESITNSIQGKIENQNNAISILHNESDEDKGAYWFSKLGSEENSINNAVLASDINNQGLGNYQNIINYLSVIEQNSQTFAAYGLAIYEATIDNLIAKINFNYDDNYSDIVLLENNTSLSQYRSKEANITFSIFSTTTLDNPTPISTASQFMSMVEDNYILVEDIYLTTKDDYCTRSYADATDEYGNIDTKTERLYYFDEYTTLSSIAPRFKSLDGNGKKIYINTLSVNSEDYNNVGIFTEISANTILKNIEIVFLSSNYSAKSIDNEYYNIYNVRISDESVKNINFGLLAGKNNGIITNCRVSFENINSSIQENSFEIVLDNTRTDIKAIAGGFVGVNNGYITNSDVNGLDYKKAKTDDLNKVLKITAPGTVAGFAGQNNKAISSCYALNTSVSNSSQTIVDTMTGGFVADNTSSASVKYSYAEGLNITDDKENNPTNANNFKSNIFSLGNVGGFIYKNAGLIQDSYSNVKLTTASRSAGFIYSNEGTDSKIENCYSISKLDPTIHPNDSTTAFNYFTGTNERSQVNNSNPNAIINCYYNSNSEPLSLGKEFDEPAKALTDNEFLDITNFYGFAFEKSANVWVEDSTYIQYFAQYRPYLIQTGTETESIRTISGYSTINNNIVSYSYVEDSKTQQGTAINPILIYDNQRFVEILNEKLFQREVNGTQVQYGYLRFVCDIDMDNINTEDIEATENYFDLLQNLQSKTFVGNIDGNGFRISNLSVLGDKNTQTQDFGLFKQVGLSNLSNVSPVIKNFEIDVKELTKTNSSNVGVLAGTIVDSTIVDITLSSEQAISISGEEKVGALAGQILGDSHISKISSSLSVSASYSSQNNNKQYATKSISDFYQNKKIAYAGGIAGYVELTQDGENPHEVSNIKVSGDIVISGEIVGGIFGYLGKLSKLSNATFEINYPTSNQKLIGKYATGGLVGENCGIISCSKLEVSADYILDVDVVNYVGESITSTYNNSSILIFDSDATYPMFIGGVVGIIKNGAILDCYSKINVVHRNCKYIGGIAGYVGSDDTVKFEYKNGNNTQKDTIVDEVTYNIFNSETDNAISFDMKHILQKDGIVINSVYTTGLVYTNPEYAYYKSNGETDNLTYEDITNGTKNYDMKAVPTNVIGGLYGLTELYVVNVKENDNETGIKVLYNDIFHDVVAINNWRENIEVMSEELISMNKMRNTNGIFSQFESIANGIENIRRYDDEGEELEYVLTTEANAGYFAGKLGFIGSTSDYNFSYGNVFLNNFIGNGTINKIKNQIVNSENINVEFEFNNASYDSYSTNLRNVYSNPEQTWNYFGSFNPSIWAINKKGDKIYPYLTNSFESAYISITNEDELRSMATTSTGSKVFILKNDIVLTKNWDPIDGFMSIFQSEAGHRFTIYNINIKADSTENIGFFGHAENATIKNINFVFGGRLQEDESVERNEGIITKFNQESLTWENYPNSGVGGIEVTGNASNVGVLVGSSIGTNITNCNISFYSGAKVNVEKTKNFGVIAGIVSQSNMALSSFNDIVVDGIQIGLNSFGITYPINDSLTQITIGNVDFNGDNDNGVALGFGLVVSQAKLDLNIINIQSVKLDINSISCNTTYNTGNNYEKGIGLFTGIQKSIRNTTIKLSNCLINISESNCGMLSIGGLAGFAEDCYAQGVEIKNAEITASLLNVNNKQLFVGGLIGKLFNSETINDCVVKYNKLNITDLSNANIFYFGGLIGYINQCDSLQLKDCYCEIDSNITGNVDFAHIAGAIGCVSTGDNSNYSITNAYSLGQITIKLNNKKQMNIAGFVGYITGSNKSSVNNCVASVNIEVEGANVNSNAFVYVAGFVAVQDGAVKIEKSASLCSLACDSFNYLAGFVADLQGNGAVINNCHSMSSLLTTFGKDNGYVKIGGFIANQGNESGIGENNTYCYALSGVAFEDRESYNIQSVTTSTYSNSKDNVNNIINNLKDSSNLSYIGSKLNPIKVDGSGLESDKYNNYYVDDMFGLTTIPDKTIVFVNSDASFPECNLESVGKQSLLSGLNVDYGEKEVNNNFSGIAKTNNGVIFNCTVKGNIKVNENNAELNLAGISETNNGKIINCSNYISFDVNEKEIKSVAMISTESEGSIVNSFATGFVKNAENVIDGISGLVLELTGRIESSYSSMVCLNENNVYGLAKTKGEKANIVRSYFDMYANNTTNDENSEQTSVFMNIKSSNLEGVWEQNMQYNYGYPTLKNYTGFETLTFNTGDGTMANPYKVNHIGKLKYISNLKNVKYISQEYDIDASKMTNFKTIDNGKSVWYEGNNHVIYNLELDAKNIPYSQRLESKNNTLALFKEVEVVSNLGLQAKITLGNNKNNVSSTINHVGALAGYVSGEISNCFANIEMNISSFYNTKLDASIGGLVGELTSGQILNSFTTGIVKYTCKVSHSNNVNISGLVGTRMSFDDDIENIESVVGCYANVAMIVNSEVDNNKLNVNSMTNTDGLLIESCIDSSVSTIPVPEYEYKTYLTESKRVEKPNPAISYDIIFADSWLNGNNATFNTYTAKYDDRYDGISRRRIYSYVQPVGQEVQITDYNYVVFNHNYPVQSNFVENDKLLKNVAKALQVDVYDTNSTGSMFSPIQVDNSNIDELKNNDFASGTYFVLMQDISSTIDNIPQGKVILGNYKSMNIQTCEGIVISLRSTYKNEKTDEIMQIKPLVSKVNNTGVLMNCEMIIGGGYSEYYNLGSSENIYDNTKTQGLITNFNQGIINGCKVSFEPTITYYDKLPTLIYSGYATQYGFITGTNQGTIMNCKYTGDCKATLNANNIYNEIMFGAITGLNSGIIKDLDLSNAGSIDVSNGNIEGDYEISVGIVAGEMFNGSLSNITIGKPFITTKTVTKNGREYIVKDELYDDNVLQPNTFGQLYVQSKGKGQVSVGGVVGDANGSNELSFKNIEANNNVFAVFANETVWSSNTTTLFVGGLFGRINLGKPVTFENITRNIAAIRGSTARSTDQTYGNSNYHYYPYDGYDKYHYPDFGNSSFDTMYKDILKTVTEYGNQLYYYGTQYGSSRSSLTLNDMNYFTATPDGVDIKPGLYQTITLNYPLVGGIAGSVYMTNQTGFNDIVCDMPIDTTGYDYSNIKDINTLGANKMYSLVQNSDSSYIDCRDNVRFDANADYTLGVSSSTYYNNSKHSGSLVYYCMLRCSVDGYYENPYTYRTYYTLDGTYYSSFGDTSNNAYPYYFAGYARPGYSGSVN